MHGAEAHRAKRLFGLKSVDGAHTGAITFVASVRAAPKRDGPLRSRPTAFGLVGNFYTGEAIVDSLEGLYTVPGVGIAQF